MQTARIYHAPHFHNYTFVLPPQPLLGTWSWEQANILCQENGKYLMTISVHSELDGVLSEMQRGLLWVIVLKASIIFIGLLYVVGTFAMHR